MELDRYTGLIAKYLTYKMRPSVTYKPHLVLSDGKWHAVYNSVVGVGNTPAQAASDFDDEWNNQTAAGADYKQRVLWERKELDDKIDKLIKFMGTDKFWELPEIERTYLNRQHLAMVEYSKVLVKRIELFDKEE